MSGSTTPAVPSPSVLLAACIRAVGACWVLSLPLSLSPREDGRGRDAHKNLVLGTPEYPRVVRSPAFELALSVGRSGWDRGRPPQYLLLATSVVTRTVPYLTGRLPLAERAAARSGPGGGLALNRPPWGAETVPETPKDLCALGVDEVCG